MSEERVERRLAAILAADVAGYSRLIGEDEEGTLAALKAMRREIIDPKIAEHRGRIFKTTGDGLLAEFQSVVDALRCAVSWQAAVAADGAITWRIGIHQGDIVVEDSDMFGDGVNVAARLEALAEPGGICVSARVHEDTTGRLDLEFADLGEQHLKNIMRPVHAYGIGSKKSRPTSRATPGAKPTPRLSIVVLPFANLSSDPEQEYFVDAITDNLTTDLSRIEGSFVISRSTAFTYKGKAVDVRRIGRELGVRYVLEGSIRRLGQEVQINVQLIDAESGGHLWAERFDADLANLARAQQEITARLANSLRLELLTEVDRRIERDEPINVDARDLVMRGWALFNRSITPANREQALRSFEQALAIAPESVDARVGLAFVLGENLAMGVSLHLEQDMARSDQLLDEALERDRNHPRAHAELGRLRRLQGRLTESRIELERALVLDRNSPPAVMQCGITLLLSGSPREAIPYFEKTLIINPRMSNLVFQYAWLGHAWLLLEQITEAIDYLRKSRSANPRADQLSFMLTAALGLNGNVSEARDEWSRWLRFCPEANSMAGAAAYFQPRGYWTPSPEYVALRKKTIDVGLRLAGVPEE